MHESFSHGRSLTRTATPGVYKRGSRYVVVFRDPHGRQRKRAARTLAEARDLKATLTADVRRGEYRALSRVTFADYAVEWIESYQGRTSRGIRPETLADYRRDLGLAGDGSRIGDGAVGFFGAMPLAAIEPRDLKRYAAELAARGLAPASVRNLIAPVRALLATAHEDGLIRANPAAGLRIIQRVEHQDGESRAKALTEDELRALLDEVPGEWRLFFEFLAHTGLRIGEAVALTWADVDLGSRRIIVRRRLYRGRFDAPKSRYGSRVIPIGEALARALWRLRGTAADRGPRVPDQGGDASRPVERCCARSQAGGEARRCAVGWLPHLPPHLRDDAVSSRAQRKASADVARPPLARVHAGDLRSPPRRRSARPRLPRPDHRTPNRRLRTDPDRRARSTSGRRCRAHGARPRLPSGGGGRHFDVVVLPRLAVRDDEESAPRTAAALAPPPPTDPSRFDLSSSGPLPGRDGRRVRGAVGARWSGCRS